MIGNLQVYLGPEAINAYGAFLREFLHGQGLYLARAVLLVAVAAAHLGGGRRSRSRTPSARPVGYREWQARESTYASRTMRWSGPLLLAFIRLPPAPPHDRATRTPSSCPATSTATWWWASRTPFASAFYILAMLALGLHLYHGVWSMLQTLGLSHPRWTATRVRALAAVSLALAVRRRQHLDRRSPSLTGSCAR